jgi:hypothetical protein
MTMQDTYTNGRILAGRINLDDFFLLEPLPGPLFLSSTAPVMNLDLKVGSVPEAAVPYPTLLH